MESRSSVSLPATTDAARLSRESVGSIPDLAAVPDVRFTAELLTAELASNVVRHAGMNGRGTFDLLVECDGWTLRVEAVDRGPGFDPLAVLADHTSARRGHRGVALVDALADRWGFRRASGECRVWFELDLVPGRRDWIGRLRLDGR